MDDEQVINGINKLAHEEHELFEREALGTATDADRERLRRLQVKLDQCWDLLASGGRGVNLGRTPMTPWSGLPRPWRAM